MKETELLEVFLKNIRKAYLKARRPILTNVKKNKNNVKRGENRQISAIGEDLFGELIYDCLKSRKVFIFINQPIIYGKRQPRKPDVIVCLKKKNIYNIKYMIDLKMDTGHIRKTFVKHANNLKKICRILKNSNKLSGKDGITKDDICFTISNNASYDEVIVSWRNNSNYRKEKMLACSNDKKCNIWVLSIGDRSLNTNEHRKIDFY